MREFDAADFLRALEDACASSETKGKQFEADPSVLGPLLCSTSRELTLISSHYAALKDRFWQVHQSDDSKWRVCSARVSSEVLDGQETGFDSPEEALNEAILRCAFREALKPNRDTKS